MKKYLLIVFYISFLGICFGDEIGTPGTIPENLVQPGQTKTIVQELDANTSQSLKNIRGVFCNLSDSKTSSKELKLSMRPGQRKEICVEFSNIGDKPVSLLFGFTEGYINDGGIPICDANMTNQNIFSKHILHNTTTGIIVPASGSVIKRFEYLSSKNSSGNILGCMVYQLDKEEQIAPGKMFLMIVRNAGYIYINISGSMYNFGRRDNIKDLYTTNKNIILKIIIAILAILLIVNIFQRDDKIVKDSKKKNIKKKINHKLG